MEGNDLSKPRSSSAPSRVVIVDSDESFGVLLQHYLERLGHSVFRLTDPRYALRLLRELNADLLITTLDGEETDGAELLVGLAAEPKRTPVLLCTRHPSSSPAVMAATRALGVSQVLPRPCRFDVISTAVTALLEKPVAVVAEPTAPGVAAAVAANDVVVAGRVS
jgi:DNA-binding response OmpR family regulator